jgi:Tol biopolymer transport system component
MIWLNFTLLIGLAMLYGNVLDSPVLSFIATDDDMTDIFLHDVRTGLSHNLTDNSQPEWHMSWSREPAYLTYTTTMNSGEAGDDFYLMLRLGQPKQIVIPENRVAFGTELAPNGKLVAYFSSYPHNYSDVYLTDLESNTSLNLTQTAELSEIAPSWSSDSQHLLYLRDGNLYVIDTLTQATQLFLDYETFIELAVWSPDGQQIAFYSGIRQNQGSTLQLHSIATDGTDLRVYELNAEPRSEVLSWSPDSCCVVLGLVSGELAIVELETGHITYYAGEARRFAPVWSPDARWIAFIENRAIHILDWQTNKAYRLSKQERVRIPMFWMP